MFAGILTDFYNDFHNAKTITMLRELKSNIPKKNSCIRKANEIHLNKTDSIFLELDLIKILYLKIFFH